MATFCITEDVQGDDLVVIAASGEIDFAVSPRLKECMEGHLAAGRHRMMLDLTSASFIDSSAIGVVAGCSMRLRRTRHGSLVLVCPPENRKVLRICEIAGLEGVVELCGSREEAAVELAGARRVLHGLAR